MAPCLLLKSIEGTRRQSQLGPNAWGYSRRNLIAKPPSMLPSFGKASCWPCLKLQPGATLSFGFHAISTDFSVDLALCNSRFKTYTKKKKRKNGVSPVTGPACKQCTRCLLKDTVHNDKSRPLRLQHESGMYTNFVWNLASRIRQMESGIVPIEWDLVRTSESKRTDLPSTERK